VERARSLLALIDAIAAADAVLIATPDYNHSIPGQRRMCSTGSRAGRLADEGVEQALVDVLVELAGQVAGAA